MVFIKCALAILKMPRHSEMGLIKVKQYLANLNLDSFQGLLLSTYTIYRVNTIFTLFTTKS